ncbi:MAG: AMP-binding protein, partial [Gammaproteobacteria bacterium]|nr:AMP-binding protein [Gammaproteobacteria bacterium]
AVRDITIGELLREAARAAPDRIALIAGTPEPAARRQWTYAELLRDAERTARALRARFEPGERVVIWAPNVPEWVIIEFGAAMAGVVLVTANPALQAREVEYVINQSKSAGILVTPEFRGNRMLATVEAVRANCPTLRDIIRLDRWPEFLDGASNADVVLPDTDPGDPVMIQYTSGTTGFPKGALLHHRGLVNNAAHWMDRLGATDGDIYVAMMPLFHTAGCVLGVLGCVAVRATQVLQEFFEPGLALELNECYRGKAILGVPTMLIAMLEHPDFAATDLSSVRKLCSGGSTVPAALVRRLESDLGAQFTIVFGQTECSPVATMTRPDDTTEDKANTLGIPMPCTEAKIIDPDTGEIVPCGTVGEFCTRGYHVMLGYFDMPEATMATVDADGWLHTGDLCSMDERGYFTVQGRLKDMIIRGGENIYPREIEELLFQHPKIAEVAVVGLPDPKWGEIVGAFIRDADSANPASDEELRAYCREHLSPQKTPAVWGHVDAFPLTGSGKIQKFVLRDRWSAASGATG